MAKKIAFIGTHGSGKTTLAHELVVKLKKKSKNVEFLPEIVRDCPFPVNEGATKKAQLWVLFMQIIKEFEKEEKADFLICDRSILDPYVYYVRKFGRLKFIEPLVINHLKTYDLLIKVPIRENFLINDNFRSIDKKFQKEIDELIDKFLKGMKIKYVEYKEGINLEEFVKC